MTGRRPSPKARDYSTALTAFLGLRFDRVTPDEVTAGFTVNPERHHHPQGFVHGGVYATVAETLASLGAHLSAAPEGKLVAGIENHTSFLRQVREGDLRARATPIRRGHLLHLWTVTISDELDRTVAYGTVRLILLDPLSDQTVELAADPREPS